MSDLPPIKHPAFWFFPKGHAEAGDTSPISTAIRELEEETSLCVRLENILKFASASASASGGDGGEMEGRNAVEWDGSFAERYLNPVRRVGKEVRFWVAVLDKEEAEREIRVQEEEVEGYRWCSWEEAAKMMTFDVGRNMLKRVRDCLENKEKVEVEIKAKV
ncbi:hypothetical protein ACMFMG_010494 [Clarireedia jacksonii]